MSTMLALEFASCGDYIQLEVLLRVKERGFNINFQDNDFDGKTALHWTSMKGYHKCCEILLQNGADPSIRMNQGWTPAHCAAENGHLKILHLLGKYGGSLLAKDDYGATPKNIAEIYGHKECVELLAAVEASPSFKKEIVKENFVSAARRSLKSEDKVKKPKLVPGMEKILSKPRK